MTSKEKNCIIYKETARILDELQMTHGIQSLYEAMCSYLHISRYIQNLSVISSDIDNEKIKRLQRIKNISLEEMRDDLHKLIEKLTYEQDNQDSLYEYFLIVHKLAYSEEDVTNTMEDILEYNKKVHSERFSNLFIKLGNITLKCHNYKDIEVKRNSVILLYPPFIKPNILEEKFNHREMVEWIEEMLNRQSENIHILILSKEMPDNFVVYTDFSDKVKLNKRDKNNLKLFVHKASVLIDSELSDIDF